MKTTSKKARVTAGQPAKKQITKNKESKAKPVESKVMMKKKLQTGTGWARKMQLKRKG